MYRGVNYHAPYLQHFGRVVRGLLKFEAEIVEGRGDCCGCNTRYRFSFVFGDVRESLNVACQRKATIVTSARTLDLSLGC